LPVEVADQPIQIEQGPLVIVIETPPEGMATVGYSFCFHASGGTKPYTWALTGGSLPAGLSLSLGGHVTGTPTAEGGSTAVLTATDADGNTDTEAFGFVVLPLPSKGITEVESTDGSITVTNGTGPIVDLATAGGGSALEYVAYNEDPTWIFGSLGGFQTYETTPDLDIGTWLLTMQANYLLYGLPPDAGTIRVVPGTATATFIGPTQATGGGAFSVNQDFPLSLTCIVKVTVKGSLFLQVAGNYRGQLMGSTTTDNTDPATGYTAVRVSPSAS
jgi:hypothetical protein